MVVLSIHIILILMFSIVRNLGLNNLIESSRGHINIMLINIMACTTLCPIVHSDGHD